MVVVSVCTISNGMKLSSRLIRRVVIAIVFLATFTLLGYGTKQLTTPIATCTDLIMNGEEEGVDCGLTACGKDCEPDLDPPSVKSTKLIKAGKGDYDFVAEIINPNIDFGASEVEYELALFNSGESELLKEAGIFYIFPGQTKYLILPALTTEKEVKRIDFKILNARWQKIESLEGMNLIVRRDKYTVLPGGLSSKLEAVIFNDSDFDFNVIDVDILVRNVSGEIIAINRTDIRTLIARTERGFIATWPFPIEGKIAEIEIIPSTNLFENLNFIKRYGSGIEKFQQY